MNAKAANVNDMDDVRSKAFQTIMASACRNLKRRFHKTSLSLIFFLSTKL
jgi:hypothetical protein